MVNSMNILYVCVIVLTFVCSAQRIIDDFVKYDSSIEKMHGAESGIEFIIGRKGIVNLNRMSPSFVAEALKRCHFDDSMPIDGVFDRYILTNITMNKFTQAQKYQLKLMEKENVRFQWQAHNMALVVNSVLIRLNKKLGSKRDAIPDNVQLHVNGLNFKVEFSLTKNSDGNDNDGHPKIVVDMCVATMKNYNVIHLKGDDSIMVNGANNNGAIRRQVLGEACRKLQQIFEEMVHEKVAMHSMRIPLVSAENLKQSLKKTSSLLTNYFDTFVQSFASLLPNMSIDLSLTKNPTICTRQQIAIFDINGEISWLGRGGTPFFPKKRNLPFSNHHNHNRTWFNGSNNNKKMAYLSINEFVMNSLLYHVFKRNVFVVSIDNATFPKLKLFSKQICRLNAEKCLDKMFAELSSENKNPSLKMAIWFNKAPSVKLFKFGQVVKVTAEFNMVVAIGNKKLSTSVLFTFTCQPRLEKYGDKMQFNDLRINSLKITLKDSSLEKDRKTEMDQLSDMIRYIIDIAFEELLKNELLLPGNKYFTWRNIEMKIWNGYITLESDFDLKQIWRNV